MLMYTRGEISYAGTTPVSLEIMFILDDSAFLTNYIPCQHAAQTQEVMCPVQSKAASKSVDVRAVDVRGARVRFLSQTFN